MLGLNAPDTLFNKQKLVRFNTNVDNKTEHAIPCKVAVVYELQAKELPTATKDMLDKIIMACRFKIEEAVYINRHLVADTSLGVLQSEFSPVLVLVFGDISVSRNLTKLQNNVPYVINGMHVICMESITSFSKNDAAKKTLWALLKKVLGIQ